MFGATDSGVPNVAGSDGLTFLDAVWAQAPFRDDVAFVQTVRQTAAAWVSAGLLTQQQADAVTAGGPGPRRWLPTGAAIRRCHRRTRRHRPG